MGAATTLSIFGVGFFSSCAKDEDINPTNNNYNALSPTANTSIVINDNTVVIDLNSLQSLKNDGGWVLIQQARMLVVNNGNGFNSLTSVCTHSGSDNNWSLNSKQFVCSCHGSIFTLDGIVVNGPATEPLQGDSSFKCV